MNVVVNNVTHHVDIQVNGHQAALPPAQSNYEYLAEQFWHAYDSAWQFTSEITLWFLFQCSVVTFVLQYVL